MRAYVVAAVVFSAVAARASECGEARVAYEHFKAAAKIEQEMKHAKLAHDAREQLDKWEKKFKAACVPKKANIAALPLGYVSHAPGNASKTTFDAGDAWKLSLSTRAGASSGIVFGEAATIDLPSAPHWETEAGAKVADIWVAVATDASITVEEPAYGKATFRIDLKGAPKMVPMQQIRACAAGKGDAGLKLDKAGCAMLARVDPFAGPQAMPERGRAILVGEWQYGWHSGLEVSDLEMSEAPTSGPPARLDLALTLSAPIAGVSDGKRLDVSFEANGQQKSQGATFKLAHDCGPDDEACEKQRFGVEIWYDRVFGVPLARVRGSAITAAKATGKVADRLARPMVGQRVMLIDKANARKIITITDDIGEYHFEGLAGGEALVFPVGKKPTDKPGNEESRKATVGSGESKVPILYVTKLFE